jgi:hypothetical protein
MAQRTASFRSRPLPDAEAVVRLADRAPSFAGCELARGHFFSVTPP